MVIRRRDPDDVTLQGVVTPSQDIREEASEIPKHTELTGRHISYRGGPPALRQRRTRGRSKEGPHPDIASTKGARYHRRNLNPETEVRHSINNFDDKTSNQTIPTVI